MDELGQGESEFGLIHGDLLLKNILFHEGEVRRSILNIAAGATTSMTSVLYSGNSNLYLITKNSKQHCGKAIAAFAH